MAAAVNFFKSWWWLFLVVAGGIWLMALLIGPGPPRTITIAGGSAGGAYAKAAQDLAAAMDAVGVRATVLETQGTVDNLARLAAGSGAVSGTLGGADVGLVQGGVAPADGAAGIESLGGIFLEPVWVFVRADQANGAQDLQALRGLRVAAAKGSGARALAERLLADQGLSDAVTLVDMGSADAAAALRAGGAGGIDAAVMVASPRASWVKALLATPGVRLVPFERAPAFARLYPFAASVSLHRGVVDLATDLPAADVPLMAATAQVAVRADLHPALQGVLLEAIGRLYEGGDQLSPHGAFPTRSGVDLPLSEEARRYYETGPTFLRRVLPYWWANLLERAWIVILPALTLLIPLIRAAPPVYRWRVRSRIYRWYRDLTALEIKGRNAVNEAEKAEVRRGLAQMLRETAQIEVPLGYAEELFSLRSHIAFVDQLIATGEAIPTG